MTLRRRLDLLEARRRPRSPADTGARQRLAERVARLIEAADGGDEGAAAQLDRLRAHMRDLTEGRTP